MPMIRRLRRVQLVRGPIDAVWDYFATPANLDALTPPELQFHIVSDLPPKMFAGQLIEYRVKFAPLAWAKWLTEIRHVREREYFADDQRIGPYNLWYHEHHFEPAAGGVKMTDVVTYSVGYGWLGWLVERFWVRQKLNAIFDYRARKIDDVFRG